MALFNFKFKKSDVQNNWKTASAVSLALLAALGVGLTCAFFPPALGFVAGITLFGAAPFAGLASMSVVAASFAAAGIAAAAVFAASAVVNAVTKLSNLFDNLFRTKKTHITNFKHEHIVNDGFGNNGFSFNNPLKGLGSKLHSHPSKKVEKDLPKAANEEDTLHRSTAKTDAPSIVVSPTRTTPEVKDLGQSTNRYTTYQPAEVQTDVVQTEESKLVIK
ncbi:hypothetical protein ACNVED_14525 [Legionella sp. D16C41]|uniref:hypothetical protein n=1 Tax=Legionella sp. D16C41 TaxID=3402688 RepID=UPI003AF8395D